MINGYGVLCQPNTGSWPGAIVRRWRLSDMVKDMDLEEHVRLRLEIGGSPRGSATFLILLAAQYAPESFMHLVPADVQLSMREGCANPPSTPDELVFIESATYRPSQFAGLTDEQIREKIESGKAAGKRELFDGMLAVHRYFSTHAHRSAR